jgi:protein-tyrosine kinase
VPAFVDLSVMPAGTLPPNPQELLAREGFRNLNTQLESRYDVVLYDVPPFQAGVDALAVASRAGGALLVDAQELHAHLAHRPHRRAAGRRRLRVLGSVVMEF